MLMDGFEILDVTLGWQMYQTRGVIETEQEVEVSRAGGKDKVRTRSVAVAIGMGEVSSVQQIPRVGDKLQKGDLTGMFQYGGSNFIVIFDRFSRPAETHARPLVKRNMGQAIYGMAFGEDA